MAYKKNKLVSIPRKHNASTHRERNRTWTRPRINETINNFQQIITSAANKSFGIPRLQKSGKDRYSGGAKNVKSPCKRVITLSTEQHSTNENLTEFKRKRANFRRIIKENKKRTWRNYITSINLQTPTSAVCKKKNQMHKWIQTFYEYPILGIWWSNRNSSPQHC